MSETARPGYLRYKCKACGVLIKIDRPDPLLDLKRTVANNGELTKGIAFFGIHENCCDEQRVGLTELIGCTFSDEATKYCAVNAE